MALLSVCPPVCTSVELNGVHGRRNSRIPLNAAYISGPKNIGQATLRQISRSVTPTHQYLHKSNKRLSSKIVRVVSSISDSSDTTSDKNELFKDAAKAGDLNKVRELLASGEVDVNLPSPARSGWTALQLGAFYGHPEVTSYLLWAGADTEIRSDSGNTALQFACLKGNISIARMLLEAGADLDALSNDKGSAMDYAQEWGGDDIVDFLLLWAAQTRTA